MNRFTLMRMITFLSDIDLNVTQSREIDQITPVTKHKKNNILTYILNKFNGVFVYSISIYEKASRTVNFKPFI